LYLHSDLENACVCRVTKPVVKNADLYAVSKLRSWSGCSRRVLSRTTTQANVPWCCND